MRPELLSMLANRGCFQYDDYELEAQLGPRELRPMTNLGFHILYEGEWKRNTDIPHGRCVAVTLDRFQYAMSIY